VQNPTFFDHLKIRSDISKNTKRNNKDLELDFGGQFIQAKGGQGH
jgi:hypothetical protein